MVPYYPSPTAPWEWISDASSTTATGCCARYVSNVTQAVRALPIPKPPKNWRWFHAFWPAFDLVRSAQYIEVLIHVAIIRVQERFPYSQKLARKRRKFVQLLSTR